MNVAIRPFTQNPSRGADISPIKALPIGSTPLVGLDWTASLLRYFVSNLTAVLRAAQLS